MIVTLLIPSMVLGLWVGGINARRPAKSQRQSAPETRFARTDFCYHCSNSFAIINYQLLIKDKLNV